MNPLTRLFLEIALQSATIILFVASIACFIFGIALIFWRDAAIRASERMNRWVSTRQLLRPMEAHRDIQKHLYRRHPWVGAFLVLGSCYVLFFLFSGFTAEPFLLVFKKSASVRAIQWVMESMWWIILVTNTFAFVIGVVMFFRPSMLKGMETWADRSYSSRASTKVWETMNLHPDRLVQRMPLLFGWMIVVGSGFTALNLGMVLSGWIWR